MNPTQLIQPPPPPPSVGQSRSTPPNALSSVVDQPVLEERLDEILPLIGVVPVAGPPVIVFVGAWVLFALMLTGPFLLLVTFVLVAVILVVVSAAFFAPPYLLVRHLRRHWTRAHQQGRSGHRVRARSPIGVTLLTERFNAGLVTGPAARSRTATLIHRWRHDRDESVSAFREPPGPA